MQLGDAQPQSVLAYRRGSNETLLVLNTLASEPQGVQMLLAEHAGVAPLDALRGERLPAIGRIRYTFTLKLYGYRWLQL